MESEWAGRDRCVGRRRRGGLSPRLGYLAGADREESPRGNRGSGGLPARQSVEISRAADLRAEKPTFEITLDQPEDGHCVVHVRMTGGPPQIEVRAVWVLRTFWPEPDDPAHSTSGGSPGNPYLLVKGDPIKLHTVVPGVDPARISVQAILESRAADDGEHRQWTHPETVDWPDGKAVRPWVVRG